jgi:hypothetical protein
MATCAVLKIKYAYFRFLALTRLPGLLRLRYNPERISEQHQKTRFPVA